MRDAFAADTLETQLERIEAAERAILAALPCPADPVTIYSILAGEIPEPWLKRSAARSRERAKHALHVLVLVQQVRGHVEAGEAARAADTALLVGALAGDGLIEQRLGAAIRRKNQRAARHPRETQRRELDMALLDAVAAYRRQHPTHSQRALAAHVARRLHRKPATVRAALQRLQKTAR